MNPFTAGPWTTDQSQSFYVKAPDGTVICNANTQANQELIREAPEMARALEGAKVALTMAMRVLAASTTDSMFENAKATIRAARDEAAVVLVNAVGEG